MMVALFIVGWAPPTVIPAGERLGVLSWMRDKKANSFSPQRTQRNTEVICLYLCDLCVLCGEFFWAVIGGQCPPYGALNG
jgi:hypothetical protein